VAGGQLQSGCVPERHGRTNAGVYGRGVGAGTGRLAGERRFYGKALGAAGAGTACSGTVTTTLVPWPASP
jgi:hypothetical protein